VLVLACLAAAAAAQDAAVHAFTAPDGSRFVLLPRQAPPVVHWTVFTPTAPDDDPDGLDGLALAVARASLAGPFAFGSRDRAAEEELLGRIEAHERRISLLLRAGRDVPAELSEALRADTLQAMTVADSLAWERALRQAPASGPRLARTAGGTLLSLTAPVEAVGRVAQLLLARREGAALRGLFDELRAVRAELAAAAARHPWTAVRDELRSLAYGTLPAGRPSITRPEAFAPLSRAQAWQVWVRTQRPDRSVHVLTGGFEVEALAEALRASFASSALTADPWAPPWSAPEPRSERRSRLTQGALSGIALGLRPPAGADPDAVAIATEWLAGGEGSFLQRWLETDGAPASRPAATWPYPAPGPDALVLLEVAVEEEHALDPERVRLVFAEVDAALDAAAQKPPEDHELQLTRARLAAAHAAARATPEGLAAFVAVRCGAFGMPPDRALRPVDAVRDREVVEVLRAMLSPARRVRVTQEQTMREAEKAR